MTDLNWIIHNNVGTKEHLERALAYDARVAAREALKALRKDEDGDSDSLEDIMKGLEQVKVQG